MLWKSELLGGGLASTAGGGSIARMAASSSASVVSSEESSGDGQVLLYQGRNVLVDETILSANRTILGLVGTTSASAGVVFHRRGPTQGRVGMIPPAGWQAHLMPKLKSGR